MEVKALKSGISIKLTNEEAGTMKIIGMHTKKIHDLVGGDAGDEVKFLLEEMYREFEKLGVTVK